MPVRSSCLHRFFWSERRASYARVTRHSADDCNLRACPPVHSVPGLVFCFRSNLAVEVMRSAKLVTPPLPCLVSPPPNRPPPTVGSAARFLYRNYFVPLWKLCAAMAYWESSYPCALCVRRTTPHIAGNRPSFHTAVVIYSESACIHLGSFWLRTACSRLSGGGDLLLTAQHTHAGEHLRLVPRSDQVRSAAIRADVSASSILVYKPISFQVVSAAWAYR